MPTNSSSSSSADRISRLEHILGGKSRRITEGAAVNTQSENHDNPNVVDGMVPQNSRDRSKTDHGNVEEVGLETAMKQLMEATHDALVNMKGEIVRMQYDLERALMEINSVQHREELLQHRIEEKAMELEKDFSRQIHELQENVILEFKLCKEQTEESMIEKLRQLVKEMKTRQHNGRKSKRLANQPPHVKESVLEQRVELRPKCSSVVHSSDKENSSSNISHLAAEERATLTEAMLQRISPKRLEQSAAVVRGWLQSPTPSDASSIAPFENARVCNPKRRLSNLSMSNLVSSVKQEAKMFATHRRVSSLSQSKLCEPLNPMLEASNTSDMLADAVDQMTPKTCSDDTNESPVSVLDDAALENYKENLDGCIFDDKLPLPREHQDGRKNPSLLSCVPNKPTLRILQPKNFKISDLLLSDSEEDVP